MTMVKVKGGIEILRLPVNEKEHVFPPWHMKYTESHILHSKCSKTGQEDNGCLDNENACQFCTYSRELEMILPDMVFPNNVLRLKHKNGAFLEFKAFDALKRVASGKINIELACAESWRETRQDNQEYLKESIPPFDWTYTTEYMGTASGFKVENTDERIDFEKLKRKDKILFYVDLTLFEDELHDNGIASMKVKMRVMPGTFYILLRYFLRIDNVMLRVNETRIYHDLRKSYLLREFTSREAKVQQLKHIHPAIFTLENEIAPLLPLVRSYYHKLIIDELEQSPSNVVIPASSSSDASSTEVQSQESASPSESTKA
ncbi:TIP41-like protein [Copidosoma floridanum]|uniref:TIP41-like protein n=1 Tax=Copidosoma floridanum TaxID=29053 RepID=UPI0006C986E0|nr:TIP41-like protein [Copidosoma floridanum]XP_014209211.1 TIP41-like protein [Copidosoma floridanum]XP_014209212.1 TIP41-like protein [Copidosoma floridanum]